MIGFNDMDFEGMVDDIPMDTLDSLRDQLIEANIKLVSAEYEAKENWAALVELVALCKEHKFEPYLLKYAPFKNPKEMTKEELISANDEATTRIQSNRHAKSLDAIPMPSMEEREKLANEQMERGNEDLLNFLKALAVPNP
jgi:hypothetical protein